MASWRKVCFYYDKINNTSAASFTATTTATGYAVASLYDMSPRNRWLALDTTNPQYITLDTGANGIKTMADYLCIQGHNFGDVNVDQVMLQYSDDGLSWTNAFTAIAPTDNNIILKEFSNPGSRRAWRLYIYASTGMLVIPYMTICIWGMKTELDYVSGSFDPYQQDAQANVNLSYGGVFVGAHIKYIQRTMNLSFNAEKSVSLRQIADGSYTAGGSVMAGNDDAPTVYEKIKHWWDNSALDNFFVAWDLSNNPKEVFLMRSGVRFNNPLDNGGLYRNISVSLTGVRD